MERRLKERLTGAVVLVVVAVIFIPMILDNSARNDMEITATNIPPAPDIEFRETVEPVEVPAPLEQPQMVIEPAPLPEPQPAAVVSPDTTISTTVNTDATQSGTTVPPVTEGSIQGNPAEPGASASGAEPVPTLVQPTPPSVPDDSRRNLSAWVIQLGSFSSRQNAESLIKQLQTNGFPGYIEQVKSGAETVYKVRVGPELSRTEAETIQKNLKSRMNIDAIILRFP